MNYLSSLTLMQYFSRNVSESIQFMEIYLCKGLEGFMCPSVLEWLNIYLYGEWRKLHNEGLRDLYSS
jgi:hypothetical protein